ncbi:unnamed protein product, partial [Nesidiocoris tenuis]
MGQATGAISIKRASYTEQSSGANVRLVIPQFPIGLASFPEKFGLVISCKCCGFGNQKMKHID